MKRKKVGLVLGRFNQLHVGHIYLMEKAFQENNQVVVCIGSAQEKGPLPVKERRRRVEKQLKILGRKNYRIVELIDPQPMKIWVSYMKDKCKISNLTDNTFYRCVNDFEEYKPELRKLGFKISIPPKIDFYYRAPDKQYYKVHSATQIKNIHKKLHAWNQL